MDNVNIITAKNLAVSLSHCEYWKKAYAAAEKFFNNSKTLISGGEIETSDLEPVDLLLFADFTTKLADLYGREIFGYISLKEVYDTPSILLEIKFEKSIEAKVVVEIVFNEIGETKCAAIF